MGQLDPKGYYAALGVSPTATAEEIKQAFRKRAKELHPDRNRQDAYAAQKFQRLKDAYDTLSNAGERARYDTSFGPQKGKESTEVVDPVVCSRCGKISAQPRYVIFWQVISFVLVTIRRPTQGIFCRRCADRAAIKASAVTWFAGWWGFPWGPIYSLATLLRNISGGEQPPDANGSLLGRQAVYFAHNGRLDIARGILEQALKFKVEITLRVALQKLQDALGKPDRSQHLSSQWAAFRGSAFVIQITPMLIASFAVSFFVFPHVIDSYAGTTSGAKSISTARIERVHVTADSNPLMLQRPDISSTAIGSLKPFETVTIDGNSPRPEFYRVKTQAGLSGYVLKEFVAPGDGRTAWCAAGSGPTPTNGSVVFQTNRGKHRFEVRNGLSTDAFVKLRRINTTDTALAVYVTAQSDAVISNVPDGTYDIIYATGSRFSRRCGKFVSNMSARRFEQSHTFAIREQGNYVYTSVLQITLNPVVGGNARTASLSNVDFE